MNYRLHIPLTDRDFRRLVASVVVVGYAYTLTNGPMLWQNIPFQTLDMPEWVTLHDRYSLSGSGELNGMISLYDLVLTAARKIWILSIDEGN